MFVDLIKKIRLPFKEDKVFSLLFLLVLSVPLAFTIYTRENFETIKYALWLVLFGAVIFVIGIPILRKKELNNQQSLARLPKILLIGFIFFVGLSVWFSPDRINSIFGFYYRFANSLLFYGLWAGTIFVLIFKSRKQHLLVLLKVLIFDALIISILGILQTQGIAYYESLDMPSIARAPSLLGNPIFSSMFVVSLIPFVVYFWFLAERFLSKLYYGLTGVFMVSCVLLLASRGAWVGLIAGVLTMYVIAALYSKHKRILAFGFMGLIVVFGLVFGVIKTSGFQNGRLTLSLSEENTTTRLYAWEMARQAIISHPLVGVGMGNFQQYFEQNRIQFLSNAVQNFDDPHNLFLQIAATAGVPALLCFVALLGLALFYAINYFKKKNDYLAVAGAGSLVIFSTAASFTPIAIPCFLFLAVLLALIFSFEQSEEQIKLTVKKPVALLFFSFGACLVVMGFGLITAEHLFYQANIAYIAQDYPKADRYSTWAIYANPTNQLYYLYKAGSQILGDSAVQDIVKTQETLISLHPKSAITYAMAGTLNFLSFLKTGDQNYFKASADYMVKSLKIDPFAANRYVRLGYFYLYNSDLDNAREWTKSGLSLDDKYLPGWFQLAKIYQIQGKKPQLVYALENALKIRPDIMELRALTKIAKEAEDPKSVPVDLPVEYGRLE